MNKSFKSEKSVDRGVKIAANNGQSRVIGTVPDIGACACKSNGMLMLME